MGADLAETLVLVSSLEGNRQWMIDARGMIKGVLDDGTSKLSDRDKHFLERAFGHVSAVEESMRWWLRHHRERDLTRQLEEAKAESGQAYADGYEDGKAHALASMSARTATAAGPAE